MSTALLSGLRVSADVVLPATTVTAADALVDVRIRRHRVPENLPNARPVGSTSEWARGHFLCRVPPIGRLLVANGETLDVDTASGADSTDLLPIALSLGMAAILLQRGAMPLRAAALVVNGEAILIAGRGGTGKSTIAAAVSRDSVAIACDDLAALALSAAGAVIVWPDGRLLQLFTRSIDYLGLGDSLAGEVRPGTAKQYVRPALSHTFGALRVRAIYVLSDDEPQASRTMISRLPELDAAATLLAHAGHRRLVLAAGSPSIMRLIATILREVPVFAVSRPRGLDRLDDTIGTLRAHWRSV